VAAARSPDQGSRVGLVRPLPTCRRLNRPASALPPTAPDQPPAEQQPQPHRQQQLTKRAAPRRRKTCCVLKTEWTTGGTHGDEQQRSERDRWQRLLSRLLPAARFARLARTRGAPPTHLSPQPPLSTYTSRCVMECPLGRAPLSSIAPCALLAEAQHLCRLWSTFHRGLSHPLTQFHSALRGTGFKAPPLRGLQALLRRGESTGFPLRSGLTAAHARCA